MATVAELNAKVDLAVTYIGAANWSAAQTALLQAQAILIAIPESEKGGREGSRVKYGETHINSLLAKVVANLNRSTGIQRTKVRYKRPNADDTYC